MENEVKMWGKLNWMLTMTKWSHIVKIKPTLRMSTRICGALSLLTTDVTESDVSKIVK